MKYRVEIGRRAERQFRRIRDRGLKRRILEAMASLEDNPRPHGCEKIGGVYYRVRVGGYRVIYAVLEGEGLVLIDSVKRRDESTYREYR